LVAGDIVVTFNATGFGDGQVGLVVKVEHIGMTYHICWVLMSDGSELPFWPEELRSISEDG